MISIHEQRYLITGGTSGLGRALVAQLVDRGARVATFARHSEPVARLKAEIPKAHVFRADVSKKSDIAIIAAEAFEALGGVDVLVNNASSLGPVPLRLLPDTACEDFEDVLQSNLLGPFRLTKAVLPGMLTQGRGLIVNISSGAAVNGYSGWGAYSASKAALDQLTRVLNAELGQQGIHAVAVDPGDMDTPMHFLAIPDADPKSLKSPALSAKQLLEWVEAGDFSLERINL